MNCDAFVQPVEGPGCFVASRWISRFRRFAYRTGKLFQPTQMSQGKETAQ